MKSDNNSITNSNNNDSNNTTKDKDSKQLIRYDVNNWQNNNVGSKPLSASTTDKNRQVGID